MHKKLSRLPLLRALSASPLSAHADANSRKTLAPIDNPIVLTRAAAWLVRDDKGGGYSFIGSSPNFDEIDLREACRLNELKLAEPKV
ncbi:alpha-N-arabinofuranosidase, partial [Pseudoalteromonas sp. S4491]